MEKDKTCRRKEEEVWWITIKWVYQSSKHHVITLNLVQLRPLNFPKEQIIWALEVQQIRVYCQSSGESHLIDISWPVPTNIYKMFQIVLIRGLNSVLLKDSAGCIRPSSVGGGVSWGLCQSALFDNTDPWPPDLSLDRKHRKEPEEKIQPSTSAPKRGTAVNTHTQAGRATWIYSQTLVYWRKSLANVNPLIVTLNIFLKTLCEFIKDGKRPAF